MCVTACHNPTENTPLLRCLKVTKAQKVRRLGNNYFTRMLEGYDSEVRRTASLVRYRGGLRPCWHKLSHAGRESTRAVVYLAVHLVGLFEAPAADAPAARCDASGGHQSKDIVILAGGSYVLHLWWPYLGTSDVTSLVGLSFLCYLEVSRAFGRMAWEYFARGRYGSRVAPQIGDSRPEKPGCHVPPTAGTVEMHAARLSVWRRMARWCY